MQTIRTTLCIHTIPHFSTSPQILQSLSVFLLKLSSLIPRLQNWGGVWGGVEAIALKARMPIPFQIMLDF